ncbi:hypothetical protein FRB98_009594 [Tulasnella sp. 332]|nr:hypothetical protein FRB98_009594 [Tulasnella sp. 332]
MSEEGSNKLEEGTDEETGTTSASVIALPRLDELELQPLSYSTEWFNEMIRGLELSSLRRASLTRPYKLKALSMKYPALEELVLHCVELQCLRNTQIGESIVCPRLHALDFPAMFIIEPSFLVGVVTSRRDVPGVSPIRSLIVRGCDSIHMDYGAIMALGGQGLTKVMVKCLDASWAQESGLGEDVSVFGSESGDEVCAERS